MTYVKVCDLDIIPSGSMKQFRVNEKDILVIHLDNGVYCVNARCTHAGAPLAEGELDNDVLTCPWHGSQFRISNGEVLRGPAKQNLTVYDSKVKDGSLFVNL